MLSDFWAFIVAVFWRWQIWLGGSGGGGAIVVLVALYHTLWGKEMPKRMYIAIFIVGFLFFAFFMAWRDQYHAVEAANAKAQAIQKQFDALTVPIISGKFVSGSAAPTGEKKENCIVTLVVHIKNLGAPTALENISISITRDAKEFDAQFVPASNVTLFYGSNPAGPAISFGFENHLIKKAAHSPILTNVPIDAWFQILVLGLSRDEFFSKGTTISLSFDQVATGKRMSITHVIKGGPSEFPLDQKKLYQESR